MLFYLTNSLIANSGDEDYLSIRRCIKKLATAVTEHKHLLLGDFEAIHYFNEIMNNPDEDESRLFNMLEQNEAINPIPDEITYYIEVVRGEPTQARKEGDVTIAQVSYKMFEDTSSCDQTALLCEDDYDCIFFKHIYKWYKENVCTTRLSNSLESTLGAGGHIVTEIKKMKRKKRACLAIIDSDKKYPTHNPGNKTTYKKCLGIKESSIYKLLVLNVQEVENLIPIEYINQHQFLGDGIINKKHFDTLLNNNHTEYILQYLDLKKGIKKKDVADDANYQTFVSFCYFHNTLVNQGLSFNEFLLSIEDNDFIQKPLQESILKNVLDEIKEREKLGVNHLPYLMNFQEDEWKKIGQYMLNWGCSIGKESLL